MRIRNNGRKNEVTEDFMQLSIIFTKLKNRQYQTVHCKELYVYEKL